MGNGIFNTQGMNEHLTDHQPFTSLEQAAIRNNISIGSRFSQEIDVQAGSNGQGHLPNLAENSHIGGTVSEGHHGRTRYRAAWSQVLMSNGLAKAGCAGANLIDDTGTLGEHPGQK